MARQKIVHITVEGGPRQYRQSIPDSGAEGKPVWICFRGKASANSDGDPRKFLKNNGFEQVTEDAVLIAPFSEFIDPNGNRGWNTRALPGVSDYAMLDVIRSNLAELGVDMGKITAVGFSYGGGMTWACWVHMSDMFGAFAPVSNSPGTRYADLDLERRYVWYKHGTDDPTSPYAPSETHMGFLEGAKWLFGQNGESVDDADTTEWELSRGMSATRKVGLPDGYSTAISVDGGKHTFENPGLNTVKGIAEWLKERSMM